MKIVDFLEMCKKMDDSVSLVPVEELEKWNTVFGMPRNHLKEALLNLKEIKESSLFFKGCLNELRAEANLVSKIIEHSDFMSIFENESTVNEYGGQRSIVFAKCDIDLINGVLKEDVYEDVYILENRNALEGNAIIFRDHFLEDNLALLEAFVMSGVQREDILVLDKGDETLHRNEITNTFINEGFNTFVLDNACCDDKGKMLEALETIEDFCKVRANKGVIILDDGAIISKVLDKTKISNIIGIIELTEMGLRRISKLEEKIQYPILNVAKTNLKISITYVEIANSIFLKILNLLGANKIVGRNVLIFCHWICSWESLE